MISEKFRLLNKPFGRLPITLFICLFIDVSGFAEDLVFSRDVLPILSDKCFHCHGPDSKEARKGDLRLDDERDAKRDRDGYRVLDAVNPAKSELIARITTSNVDELMPPPEVGRPLSPRQIETLKAWVNQGAKWGKHWAFERVVKSVDGPVGNHPVDQLIDRKLKSKSVIANPRADRRTLIRRLKLDFKNNNSGNPSTTKIAIRFVPPPRKSSF